jgi:hypothetical protein
MGALTKAIFGDGNAKKRGRTISPAGQRATSSNDRCGLCRKKVGQCRCGETKLQPVREQGPTGRARGSKTVGVDSKGIEWCTTCRSRVNNGQCSNVTCSTR